MTYTPKQRPLPPDLKLPGAEEQARSDELLGMIREAIEAAGGSLSFARYMELALYAPGLGYYSGGLSKFGAGGDFVTAPEISPLFSACVARQCREILARSDGHEILEVGAGSGVMAAGILAELRQLDALPQRDAILELGAELRQRQRETLQRLVPDCVERLVWLDHLPQAGFEGVVVANELLDAMPVHRVLLEGDRASELRVSWTEAGLDWLPSVIEAPLLEQRIGRLRDCQPEPLPDIYRSEIGLAQPAWVASMAERLERGALLLIDYGYPCREYYHPQRSDGSLMCHYRHRAHADPLILPGLQDITAHVDFSAVAAAGVAAGLDLLGFTSQSFFLLGNGIGDGLADLQDPGAHMQAVNAIKQLTLPTGMGERFKVLALGRGVEGPLMGFAHQDRRGAL